MEIASSNKIKKLVDEIKRFELNIVGTAGFENSQVTAGGISTKEITANMQSKLVKGLYVIGEALDVDGDCGGYNLQWAFTSAMVATEDILNAKN